MTTRLSRPDVQIEHLAADLKRRWVAADGIEPWLRRHVPRLTNLVRIEGWTWNDIARALTAAGITYATGRPWSGRQLAVKAAEVRLQLRARDERRRRLPECKWTPIVAEASGAEATVLTEAVPEATLPQASTLDVGIAEPRHRTFGLARPRGWTSGPIPHSATAQPPAAPMSAPPVDVDAVLARFMGRSYPPPKQGSD